jgi:hypothetical protein
MNRDRYKTVTSKESFAILIPASPEEAVDKATFKMEFGSPPPVRPFDVEAAKKANSKLSGADAAHFGALLAMRGALESADDLALSKALGRLQHAHELREKANPQSTDSELDRQIGETFAPWFGLSPKESLKYMAGQRSGLRAEKSPAMVFSYEVSQAVGTLLQNAQIALWWFKGAFRPAIYCPDERTALYVHSFFIAPTGGIGFRVCPYDGEIFFQTRPNQDYCCPAHREAHRVARFRNGKKLEIAKAKNNRRRTNGTKKAR